MNYEETIDFLYTQLPMFSRDGAIAYKKDLRNTLLLCQALDHPQSRIKTIHVAGTNGKGSSSHMLAAILQESGYKTGLYTSPHLQDFRERIKVNGELCTEAFVIDFVEKIKPYLADIQPSFFEITVVMAFACFVQQQVDIAVIETGLGGRLDSTNVIRPEVSLITNIGMDHTQILGNTLEEIAFEKAGIIKQKVPVVISEVIPETKPVFEKAAREGDAPIYFAQQFFAVEDYAYQHHLLSVRINDKEARETRSYDLDLPGIYQLRNLPGVLETVKHLREVGWNIDEQSVREALGNVKRITGLHGRWELVHKDPTIILDVAHNAAGIKQLVQQLNVTEFKHLHIIIGFVRDKDISAALTVLPAEATYYFTKAQIPRALNERELWQLALQNSLDGGAYENIHVALHAVIQNYQPGDLILICGSVFLVAEVKDALLKTSF